MDKKISLLYPGEKSPEYQKLPDLTVHDLAVDELCEKLTEDKAEQAIIRLYLTRLTDDPEVARYRSGVFEDILRLPEIREKMQKILEKIDFLRQYASFHRGPDAAGVWELMHRMDEMNDYILSVEAIYETLSGLPIRSEGLIRLRDYAKELYEDSGFSELKKDIAAMKKETAEIRSVTLGVNLNDRYEPNSVGIVSVNSKYYTKSTILSNFSDFTYRPAESNDFQMPTVNPLASLALLMPEDRGSDVIRSMDRAVAGMIGKIVKRLRNMISRHVDVSTSIITGMIPEFMYYIRFAEYAEKLADAGFSLCTAEPLPKESRELKAEGIYNLRLANEILRKDDPRTAADVIGNDLDFSAAHRIYILTGANRGGKTTFTQAVGLSFVLAQGGVRVPAKRFSYSPVDNIFTHYPADENQTLDLGRLGEETKRFRELYLGATPESLLLLNESFSTTSYEEGFYIARDVVRSLLHAGIRTIYNTHMHKLAIEAEELSRTEDTGEGAVSLIAETRQGERSFHIRVAPPEGSSYARDIAEKYGVTFERLTADFGASAKKNPENL